MTHIAFLIYETLKVSLSQQNLIKGKLRVDIDMCSNREEVG
jgi:hypothetical protein